MMRLKKDQFKKILKECILELISEGAFDKVISENLQNAPGLSGGGVIKEFVGNGESSYKGGLGLMTPNQRLKEVARMTALGAANGDPKQADMLSKIFEDTAITTLQKQIGSINTGDGNMFIGEQADPHTEATDKAELQALSGRHGINHWAALAFGNTGRKK